VLLALAIAITGCARRNAYYASNPASGYRAAPPSGSTPRPNPAGWTSVRPPNVGFRCQMPAPPQQEGETGTDLDGATFQTFRTRATTPLGRFVVIVTHFEGGVVGDSIARARALADHIVELTETDDHRSARISIAGFYGREDRGHTSDGAFFAVRQFVGRNRIYVAVALTDPRPAGLRAAEQFMGSIELDRRDAMLPFGDSPRPVPMYLPDVDFAVTMPPLDERRTVALELANRTADAHVFVSRHPHGAYRVTVVELGGGDAEGVLQSVAGALSLGEPSGYVHASGFPGRSYAGPEGSLARAFVTEGRVYVQQLTGADALGASPAETFFTSFRIL